METAEHKNMAAELFNGTWDLIDKTDRTKDDDFTMINMAHASVYHHSMGGGGAQQKATGHWQISHVYALADMGESALAHAQYCLDTTLAGDLSAFNVAFGYEALARAYAVLKDAANMQLNKQKGLEAAAKVEKAEDKEYVSGEINGISL